MQNMTGLFSPESVSHGHPDKICDQISDATVDACLAEHTNSRVAVEVAIKGNLLCILGELTTHAAINADMIARQVLRDIGHISGRWGVDADQIRIIEELSKHSSEIGARLDAVDDNCTLAHSMPVEQEPPPSSAMGCVGCTPTLSFPELGSTVQ